MATNSYHPEIKLFKPETKSSKPGTNGSKPATPRELLNIPAQLRLVVYRHLFCHPTAIKLLGKETHALSAQILPTCRLIYTEGVAVLYGENTFEIGIGTHSGISLTMTVFMTLMENPRYHSWVQSDMMRNLRRFSIRVGYPLWSDISYLREKARAVVRRLQALPSPTITFLRLHLDVKRDDEEFMLTFGSTNNERLALADAWRKYIGVLRTWLGRLTNVKKVEIEGMLEPDAGILRNRWQSNGQGKDMRMLLSLTEKYEALEEYVAKNGGSFCRDALGSAVFAVEADKEEDFERWKGTIVKMVEGQWKNLKAMRSLRVEAEDSV